MKVLEFFKREPLVSLTYYARYFLRALLVQSLHHISTDDSSKVRSSQPIKMLTIFRGLA